MTTQLFRLLGVVLVLAGLAYPLRAMSQQDRSAYLEGVHVTLRTDLDCLHPGAPEVTPPRRIARLTALLPACSVYADVSEKIVSRKPLGSLTSNARLFHSVS